jgi:hypothetical protein
MNISNEMKEVIGLTPGGPGEKDAKIRYTSNAEAQADRRKFGAEKRRLLTATDYVKNSIYFLQNQFKNIVIQYFGGDPGRDENQVFLMVHNNIYYVPYKSCHKQNNPVCD